MHKPGRGKGRRRRTILKVVAVAAFFCLILMLLSRRQIAALFAEPAETPRPIDVTGAADKNPPPPPRRPEVVAQAEEGVPSSSPRAVV